jgi:predicted HicB family RNase H-like nuclease
METTERVQVRIDRELVEALRLQASREKLSISQLVERVVREWKLKK